MGFLKKIFIIVLVLLTLNLYLPKIHFAQELKLYSESVIAKSPEIRSAFAPEIRSTPEEEIPVRKVTKKKSRWIWRLIGLAIAGGGAYYLLQEEEEEDTGSYTGTW